MLFLLNQLVATVGPTIRSLGIAVPGTPSAWRPREWSKPAQTSITVTETLPNTQSNQVDAFGGLILSPPGYVDTTVYVFDAVLRSEHSQELRHTEHPVQSGAAMSDHAFLRPARLTLEIGMSDAMDSYSSGLYTGNASKSVSAYQKLLALQRKRIFMTVTTRLRTYQNMLIENIATADTSRTAHGLRAHITFCEIFTAQITASQSANSGLVPTASDDAGTPTPARPQTTLQSPGGTVQGLPPQASVTSQHRMITPSATVPGAGSWASNNLGASHG